MVILKQLEELGNNTRRKQETSYATRTRFKDSVDFIGWYTNKTEKILKIPKNDAFKQYVAYHEGWGNYKNYKKNQKSYSFSKKS